MEYMKYIIILLIFCFSQRIDAQIVYQYTFPGPASIHQSFPTIINMGDNDYKYFYVDYATNQFNLFNLDFTLFNTVNVPIALVNLQFNSIGYVTKSLFDCDTTFFEYAIMPGGPFRNFYIFRQDGTLLFQRDSVIAPYCTNCNNATSFISPVQNTPTGAVLYLCPSDSIGDSPTWDVYSLCGNLPNILKQDELIVESYMKVFPNPTTGKVVFYFDLPSNYINYNFSIFNQSFQLLQTVKISGTTKKYELEDINLASGMYFFKLLSENVVLQTGKFIFNK